MALDSALLAEHPAVSAVALSVALLATVFYFTFARAPLPPNVPKYTTETWPIIGCMQFFTERWSFFQRQMAQSPTGNFTFHAGHKVVVALSGEAMRKVFFDSKQLAFAEGYGPMLGGGATTTTEDGKTGGIDNFSDHFSRRIIAMLKGPLLARGLPQLLSDVQATMDELAARRDPVTNPFDSIYGTVFQLTVRTVACREIADDPVVLKKCLQYFEAIEGASRPLNIMYHWMPTPAKAWRTYNGAKLYMLFKQIVEKRQKEGRREDDALQYLIDQGDDIVQIITFVLGALFAGQLNSGINAAWILVYLSENKEWLSRVRDEVNTVASRYNSDTSVPLKTRLADVPITAWESEFPMIDLCLKESIRLQSLGNMFRRNISSAAIPLNKEGTEVIPPGAFATYAVADLNFNPEIYTNADYFDPGRYLPERAEDRRQHYGAMTWGLSRHPCLGMRFAKLENNLLTAFFLAYFDDFYLVDRSGERAEVPPVNKEKHNASKPDVEVLLRYHVR